MKELRIFTDETRIHDSSLSVFNLCFIRGSKFFGRFVTGLFLQKHDNGETPGQHSPP